jgi:competence protein ComEC
MTIKSVNTRFRAYQLDTAGSSFSYCSGSEFTLIEARYCEANEDSITQELRICGVERISTLHITSWDQDHCAPMQLDRIFAVLKPRKVEYPGYDPHSDSGKESLSIIKAYKATPDRPAKLVSVTPEYIASLESATNYGYNHILYHPKSIDPDCPNNNSTVKQFRSGSFNVLSIGDVESANIASYLRSMKTIHSESDIMIMAHHGANNGFTTSAFMRKVRPTVTIATSNYANQFDHPKPEIRELLHKNNIKLFTTKTGDVIVRTMGEHMGQYEVINLRAGSTEVSSRYVGHAKKSQYLRHNDDTLRDRRTRHNHGPRH